MQGNFKQIRLPLEYGEEVNGVHLHLLRSLWIDGDGQLDQLCGSSRCSSWQVVAFFVKNVDPRFLLIRLGLLLTLLLMTINLNNSATDKIPPSDKICPLIKWILISMVFILVALVEYFLILVVLRFRDKVSENKSIQLLSLFVSQRRKSGKVRDNKNPEKVFTSL